MGTRRLSIQDLKNIVEPEKKLYVVDLDGRDHDELNLELLQELSSDYILWVDNGLRNIDDVMDTLITGATAITIQHDLWSHPDVSSIKEISDDEIYIALDLTHEKVQDMDLSIYYGVNGVVVLNTKEQLEADSKAAKLLEELRKTHKLYAFEKKPENHSYWETAGISGLFVDIDVLKEF